MNCYSNVIGLVMVFVLGLGCSESAPGEETQTCTGGKCDGNQDWIAANLEGRDDLIATFLKEKSGINKEGIFEADLLSLQRELASLRGCDPSDSRNFVISDKLIVGSEATDFPRLVSTICSKDADKRWKTFLSPPARTEDGDVDVHTVEMFSWDETRKGFNFYKTFDEGGGEVFLEVEPAVCADCHLGGRGLSAEHMPMLPIMNELTQPWEHWNASPGFESQRHHISNEVSEKPNYIELTAKEWVASAAELESTIRKAQKSVADQRVKLRRKKGPASVSETMSILRPIFCDEQVNYVSEAGNSGQILMNAVIDISMRDIFSKLNVSGEAGKKWRDINARIRLPQERGAMDRISMLPVRGDANVIYELALVSAARGLSPELAAQVRLLDWKKPVFSALRCQLWTQTDLRLKKTQLDVDVSSMRNYQLIAILMKEILTLGGVSLIHDDKGYFYILNDGEEMAGLLSAISEGAVPVATCENGQCACDEMAFCVGNVDDASTLIENHVQSIISAEDAREQLAITRKERVCIAKTCYNNAPFIEDSTYCGERCPLDAAFRGK